MNDRASIRHPAETSRRDLTTLFCPRSIAVVGASRREGSVGYAVMRNLIDGGYQGVIEPINPKARSVTGIRCRESLAQLEEVPDLAVVVTPAPYVEATVAQGAQLGTKNFVIITAGFKEVGEQGAAAESRIAELAREHELNIVGPNCLGIINTAEDVSANATFGRDMPKRGTLGLISQSGALCTALLDYAKGRGIGFSRFISFGNKVDVDEVDLMQSLAEDEHTQAILMYVEAISSGSRFLQAAQSITHGRNPKPIIVIKSGRTREGAAAAASHTGSMAGADELYDALLEQAGAFRVESVSELFDLAEIFTDKTVPRGRRTAIVTNAGGPGIMATDAAIRYGLSLSRFSDYTVKSLQFQMPASGSIRNPVDVIGDARHDRYRHALDAVSADDAVDQILVIVTPQTMTNIAEIADVIGENKDFCNKPVAACLMGMADVSEGVALLRDKYGVPAFYFPENAARAMSYKNRFGEWLRRELKDYQHFDVRRDEVTELFDKSLAEGTTQLVEAQALRVFEAYGFPTVPHQLAPSADDAVRAAEGMGFPVVMKIAGPKILHKTDVGGVRLNLESAEAVRSAYDEMIASTRNKMGSDVEIWGVLIQKMLRKGKEIILGMMRDPSLGPMLMFGLGGIYAEALHDVAFRLAPIREISAQKMVRSIRSYKLLQGVRGEPASDVKAIEECLLRLSQLVTEHPRLAELDINPLLVHPDGEGAVIADARLILTP